MIGEGKSDILQINQILQSFSLHLLLFLYIYKKKETNRLLVLNVFLLFDSPFPSLSLSSQ